MTHRIPDLWDAEPGYLNTASYGLPPRSAWLALQVALADWRGGRTSWEEWAAACERARHSFARLVGADPADVAVGSQVSALVGLVAAALPDGARVVAPDIEFASNLFPYLVHADRGIQVLTVPTGRLVDAIDERTDVVAYSAVQSATGEVADMAEVAAAADAYGAITIVDATQAVGWLRVDSRHSDVLVCAAYKWLMSPRGSAFLVLQPALAERVRPLAAGWFAGDDVHASYYGPPLRLAKDARRFDVSPGWFDWVGTAATLAVVESIGVPAAHAHDVALANRFRAGLGLPPGDSAIVSVDWDGAAERLAAAGIRAATRAGSLRASFHLYTTQSDVDAAVAALTA
ncbi:MAG: aminotransferase class V-fold PLP-dependent enzyme [Mycobacteriales bacterium]